MATTERKEARVPWNKGKLVGQKAPLKLRDVWAIRIGLQIQKRTRELALLDIGIDSKLRACDHLGTRQYARIVHHWMDEIGLDTAAYGTHSLRRTKPSLIYRGTKNLRAVQLLLGHSKLESTVRYLGIDVDDALEIAEQT